jgi:outer membrane protein insertion porin family
MRKTVCFLFILSFFWAGGVPAQESPLVNKIEIRGLKRIEEGAVKSKISQKTGEPLSQEIIAEDIKSIFKMGYFDDVRVEVETFEGGVELIYVVKEKPAIIKIDFQGNEKIEDSKLKEKITLSSGSIADTVLIQDNASKLKKFYEEEGYLLANVVPVIKKVSENEITLTYQIDEGKKIRIDEIRITGNRNISSSRIRKAMETKKWWIFSFLTSTGYYKKDQMEQDVSGIQNLYFDEGYIKAVIGEPEISIDEKEREMKISINVSEGEQFRVSSIGFKGNTVYNDAIIKEKLSIEPGEVFSKKVMEKDIGEISNLYTQTGYALVSVTPDLVPNDKDNTVDVVLNIDEGAPYEIGRIEISGNTRTRDKVIRREIRVDEGETYDSAKLKRSYERINNLNYFETVEFLPKPKYEEKVVDLEVKVKERPTGFLSVGGGYSSIDKFIATVDLTQGNLFGRGQYLKLKGELGGRSSLYELSFRDPWFLDRPVSLSTGIYKTTREYIDYDKEAFGIYLGLGKSLSEYWRGDISYNFEKAKISNISDDASLIIRDQEGTKTTSSITPKFIRDSRDNFLDPSRGSRNMFSFTFAGIGGSNAFIKGTIDSGWYFPLGATTIAVRGRFGYATGIFGDELPLYERFYVGGIYTIRGLGFGDAGPRDEETGDPIGGTEELIFNTELIFPILTEIKLKGVVFFDAGNSYDDFEEFGTLRYTTGAGIRWISPIGPIRVEWGYNLDQKPDESSNKFEFAFGSFF